MGGSKGSHGYHVHTLFAGPHMYDRFPRVPLQVKLTEDEMVIKVFGYLEKLVQIVKPRKVGSDDTMFGM